MLEAIRKGASSWIVKVLIIGPLILAFAVWGIEDMLRGAGPGTIAVVGDRELTPEEFQENYRLELDAMSRQFGRRLTAQQAQMLGLPDRVLSRMVGAATVDQHASELGVAIAPADIVRDIQRDPSFQNADGQFDRDALLAALRQSDLSEARFLDERRRDAMRTMVTAPLMRSVVVPPALLDTLHRYNNEQRQVSYFVLTEQQLGEIALPEENELKEFFEQRRTDFKTPEYRKITIVSLTPDIVRQTMNITDEEIEARYDENPTRFDVPDEREIEQIAFESREAAEAARREIAAGKDFMEVAKSAGAQEKDVKLGFMKKSDLIDSKIADAAFAIGKGEVSDVVEGDFATVLLRVVDIKPGKKADLASAKEQIRTELENERIGDATQALVDKVDDMRLSGSTPSEIADELRLKFQQVEAVDQTGKDPSGADVVTGPDAQNFLRAAFQGVVGVENEVVELQGGGYGWVDILDVTKSRQEAFEDIMPKVEAAWLEAERAKRLRDMATELAAKVSNGMELADVAKEVNASVETSQPFKRNDEVQGLPRAAVARAFTLKDGGAASVQAADGTDRIVMKLDSIVAPEPMTVEQRKNLEQALRSQRSEDALAQYLAALRQEIEVSINSRVLNQALGITEQ